MKLLISKDALVAIRKNGENNYPEEGAGLIFGVEKEGRREAFSIYPLNNSREYLARHNRYLITAKDMLKGEVEAERLGLDVIGIFHSHPDHPDRPSDFDREWAMPWFSYIITSVQKGKAVTSRSWRLLDDRTKFSEEEIEIINNTDWSEK